MAYHRGEAPLVEGYALAGEALAYTVLLFS